jgi:hypothetical protein
MSKRKQIKKEASKVDRKRDDDSDSDDADDESDDSAEHTQPKSFALGKSVKLAGLTFLAFILLMSDVFVLRVMDRAGVGLVSGRCPSVKGIVVQGILLVLAMILFDFLIAKEKL